MFLLFYQRKLGSNTSVLRMIFTCWNWLWWRVVRDPTMHHVSIHQKRIRSYWIELTTMKGGARGWEVVEKGSGEEGKWWGREVVRKGSGEEGKWWWRGVVRKGSADRIGMAAWMLHGLCCGEEAGARNLVLFRVKWLQATMKGTSSVRRVRLRSFGSFYVFCKNGCSCVRNSMRFLKLWLQIALEWLHECCMGYVVGRKSRSTKPCIFPCQVAAGDDERYLVCAAGAAAVVWFLLCVLQEWLFLCT